MNNDSYLKRIEDLEHSQEIRLKIIQMQAEQIKISLAQFEAAVLLAEVACKQRDVVQKRADELEGALQKIKCRVEDSVKGIGHKMSATWNIANNALEGKVNE